jgi:hypothetical protein
MNYLVKGDNFSEQVVHVTHTRLYYEQISINTNNAITITTITNTNINTPTMTVSIQTSTPVTIEQQIITSKEIVTLNNIATILESDSYSIESITRILVKSNKNNRV